ncbi:MAG: galactose-1-phosphate uridylyltransferase [Clostridia bacterium]|nr:galactose-1-phosphate uridylyltransferase [Clostridia bacterium]
MDIERLTEYAKEHLELKERDEIYKSNRLQEIIESGLEGSDLEDALYGELSLLPSEIDNRFSGILKQDGSKAATDWLYNYCVKNMYVKKSVLDKNPRFDTSNGLTITINKAKPEFRDPKKAKAGNSVEGGFAKCVICRENEGFGVRNKRNLRTVSLNLGGKPWFWQYSPYGYFHEHGIAVNCEHIPMHIDKDTLVNLLDFVDKFPHYFIGCNAPLPRIGGSVLAHDHYQGGGEVLPLHKAKIKTRIKDKKLPYVRVGVLDWPGTVIRIKSDKRNEVIEIAERIRQAWASYNAPEIGIVSEDKDGIHNAISPTVIKTVSGYEMNVILRSNITDENYPDGIFHAHPEYHSIKKESIGLIEAQGLFILPGRLEEELAEVERIIEAKKQLPQEYAAFKLVYDEAAALYKSGKFKDVHAAMQEELGSICYRILENTAVFKKEKDLINFLKTAGFEI